MSARSGFTLIELSIVLVIIGLIVGGVLVGRDLIHASEIRATIGQVEKYNTAVSTFRTKYNYLPGDMPSTQAVQLGFFAIVGGQANQSGYGNGDGRIMTVNLGPPGIVLAGGEQNIFWRHLSDAQLIDGTFGLNSDAALLTDFGGVTADLTSSTVGLLFPPAKLGNQVYFSEFSKSGTSGLTTWTGANYFFLSKITAVNAAAGTATFSQGITPIESYQIDLKTDDGAPNKGRIMEALGAGNGLPQGLHCTNASGDYAVDATYGSNVNCFISIQFQ